MANHQTIVALETFVCPIPPLDSLPCPYTLHSYERTHISEIHERIAQATVLLVTTIPIRADALDVTVSPHLRAIVVMASGTNNIDLHVCAQRGVVVMNSPGANANSVAQHALTLLLAARRQLIPSHVATVGLDQKDDEESQWEKKGTLMMMLRNTRDNRFPIALKEEIIGIIGYGIVGKLVADMCRALGMTVIVADRKNPSTSTITSGDRVPFEEVLRKSTAVVLCVPLTSSTMNLISVAELQLMGEQSLLINVSRGGVVNEDALAEALKSGSIGGAATDVFAKEPASSTTSPLLRADVRNTNLTVTPHLAWLAQSTIGNYQRVLIENLCSFFDNKPINVVAAVA
ncbi:2-hydroxyacid dehydrogenase, putative [Talaromyces marneffei ATCC 18224]|uniref:2-hydroxyacid dehydrogenase, putative n=1 Tax=Talaromyces marneffei (strain ATCC 18224 / CBS 334.59 / QM 7333) TaxID=441960 RepID=B6Q9L2_TALMQ|nr:2-hydroxyacid dehydrogenase, putative [Talaromyces marneffei ATCC 18224]